MMPHSGEDSEAHRHLSEKKDGIMERDLETMLFQLKLQKLGKFGLEEDF